LGRLNPLPYREVKRRLDVAGFTEISRKGSHVKFVHGVDLTVDTVIVPKKAEIPWEHYAAFSTKPTLIQRSGTSSADCSTCPWHA